MSDYETPKTMVELGEDLCDYCPLNPEDLYNAPWGMIYCKGDGCQEAYDRYLEGFEIG